MLVCIGWWGVLQTDREGYAWLPYDRILSTDTSIHGRGGVIRSAVVAMLHRSSFTWLSMRQKEWQLQKSCAWTSLKMLCCPLGDCFWMTKLQHLRKWFVALWNTSSASMKSAIIFPCWCPRGQKFGRGSCSFCMPRRRYFLAQIFEVCRFCWSGQALARSPGLCYSTLHWCSKPCNPLRNAY